jgi:hypothetical protein
MAFGGYEVGKTYPLRASLKAVMRLRWFNSLAEAALAQHQGASSDLAAED